ncbi:hypothetical protein ACFMQL_04745 [Nonomuraea fastidiosa]|jgi:hypothetical protein|uniref:hypothetical protein n=1 Tax=Nonomuraea TaxID=83681 RepID=UPI0032479886
MTREQPGPHEPAPDSAPEHTPGPDPASDRTPDFEPTINLDSGSAPGADPDRTIRHRFPRPAPLPQGSAESPHTQRLPYTPDLLPDVPVYEAKPPRSAWWWVIVAGGLVLLIAAGAVAAVLWARSNADATTRPLPAATQAVTPG